MMRKLSVLLYGAAALAGVGKIHAAPLFVFGEGNLVVEAEDASTNLSPRSDHQWHFTNSVAGFSGSGFLEGTPDNNLVFSNWPSSSPELRYAIQFPAGGTHRVWVRALGTNATSDSVHWGLNGASNPVGIAWSTYNTWVWTNTTTAGLPATIAVPGSGVHTLNLWMREDGARIDRVAVSSDTNFQPRIGNAWHIPGNVSEPGVPIMREPFQSIFSNTAVRIYNGNQFQGGANGANQLSAGSAVFCRKAGDPQWLEFPMTFHGESGNNKYFQGTIPANTFQAGDHVEYYLRVLYSDRLPTYLYTEGGVALETEVEQVARANPYAYRVLATPPPGYASPSDWRDLTIYQIFTDRFFDGDPSNNNADPEDKFNPASPLGIHGGDLKGIERKLDYIKALGANAIWISPLPLTARTNVAYHGYVARDFYQLAPHWGTEADLTNMVAEAHKRDIRVILDVVVNHQSTLIDSGDAGFPAWNFSGYNMRWTFPGNQYPAPFDNLGYFHNHGNTANYDDPTQTQLGDLRGLDDLKTETEYVRTNMVEIYKFWLDLADFDGFRLDASKHAEVGFWQHWNPEMRRYAAAKGKTNFFTFGENIAGDAANGYYTGTKAGAGFANDSALDYPLYNSINSTFATASGNTKQIEDHYNAIPTYYDPYAQNRLVTFLDNHDKNRFMSSGLANNNLGRLLNALSFLYTSRGIPCLYQGTESALNGGTSPNNREDIFDGQFEQGPSLGDNFNMTHAAFLHIAKLNNFRRLYPSLRTGTHLNRWNNPGGPGLFAYARRLDAEEVLVVLNTSGSSQALPERSSLYTPGTVLVNLLDTNETITVNGSGNTPAITVPGTSSKLFIAKTLWRPLDPVVSAQSPAHGTGNVNVHSPVMLQFSKPMDTNSVHSAMLIQPPAAGGFQWNAARTQCTFTPAGAGFQALTTIVFRVTTGAVDSVDGLSLHAPFESFFTTAAASVTDNVPPVITITSPVPLDVLSGTLVFGGTATDDTALAVVEIRLDGGPWMPASGTASWWATLPTEHFLNGSHTLFARAIDAAGNASSHASVTVRFFNQPGSYDERLAAGNPATVTNCDASAWSADRPYAFGGFGFIGGGTGFVASAVSGVCASAQTLYQYERFGPAGFNYVADCPAGIYEITLLEAETFWETSNQRVFDLYLEGVQVATNLDLLVEAGGKNRPLTLVYTAAVADARADIQFVPLIDAPRVSGIRLRKVGEVDSDADGTPDWWMLAYFDHATGQEGDQSMAGDDPDGDEFGNLLEYSAGTDPLNQDSYFNLVEISAGGIAVPSVIGRSYQLETQTLTDQVWRTEGLTWPGTGNLLILPASNDAPAQVYRAKVHIP